MDAYRYLVDLVEKEKLRKGRRRKNWVIGNIHFAKASGQITDAQAVELVAKIEGEMQQT